jgi:ketosteroid isomerase-like protein
LKKGFGAVAIVAAVVIGVWAYRMLFPGDEKLIRKLVDAAADAASVKANDNPLFRLAGANRLASYCTPDVILKVEISGVDVRTINGHDDLLQAAIAARAGWQQAKIQLNELTISVAPDRRSAKAQAVISAFLNGGDPLAQELDVRFKKIDGDWKIAQVETVKALGP